VSFQDQLMVSMVERFSTFAKNEGPYSYGGVAR